MKRILLFFLSLTLFPTVRSAAQGLPINGDWRYILKDDAAFSLPTFDDAAWKTTGAAHLTWEKTELSTVETKILWLRKKVVIPSSMKAELEKTGALALNLGRIQQEDDTYLNGKLVGHTGSGDLLRAYVLTEKDILWDKENTLAIRIRHWGDKCSVGQLPTLAAAKPNQLFVISTDAKGATPKEQVNGKDIVHTCSILNKSVKTVAAKLTVQFLDFTEGSLFSIEKEVSLPSGNNAFSFPFRSPSPFLKVRYTLSIPVYDYKTAWNTEFGYADITYQAAKPALPYKAKSVFNPADLQNQKIEGWLGDRLKANKDERLHKVDEAALLAGYINKPGAHPWIGEHVGKFLEAACNAYDNTNDAALKTQIDRTAQQLIAAQLSDGYLGTYDAASHWTSWDVWSHKYNIIGLLRFYQLSGYKPALLAAQRAGDLLCATFGYGKDQRDIIKAGTHEGMASTSVLEPMVDLYQFTGNQKYLDFCRYIVKTFNQKNGPKIIATLDSLGRVDKTANAKAYEMLSNLVGLVKLYRVTDDKQFLNPILKAWKDITDNRLYITGTTSSFEHFQDDHLLPATNKDNMGEGCVTTTWLQLNYQLFCIFGTTNYVNELERSVYNHLTGAENPQTGCVSYYTPLMGVKPYKCDITCCMSSVPRGIAMIPLFANGQIDGSPSFLFYQAGIYKTRLAGSNTAILFITKTSFPENGNVTIEVDPSVKTTFDVLLRKPYWASNFKVSVNGVEQKTTDKDLISLKRTWKKGDKINVSFTMPVKILDGNVSYPNAIAVQRGPQVLVFDKKLNTALAENVQIPTGFQLQDAVNILPKNWVGTQAYQLQTDVSGKVENIILVPYADASQTGGAVTTWLKKKQ